jgi:morphogenetic protein associated with SpoVID
MLRIASVENTQQWPQALESELQHSLLKTVPEFFHGHQGAVYSVKAGETLSSIASKCGIPLAKMRDHIWRSSGDQITLADQNTIAVNERLLIEGINWHEVIKGETMASIARIWVIPLASLINANPQVIGPAYMIHIGDKLLIPAK